MRLGRGETEAREEIKRFLVLAGAAHILKLERTEVSVAPCKHDLQIPEEFHIIKEDFFLYCIYMGWCMLSKLTVAFIS